MVRITISSPATVANARISVGLQDRIVIMSHRTVEMAVLTRKTLGDGFLRTVLAKVTVGTGRANVLVSVVSTVDVAAVVVGQRMARVDNATQGTMLATKVALRDGMVMPIGTTQAKVVTS